MNTCRFKGVYYIMTIDFFSDYCNIPIQYTAPPYKLTTVLKSISILVFNGILNTIF